MYRSSIIKSIQTGTITVNAGAGTGTATITSVNTKYAVVTNGGSSNSNVAANASLGLARVELTNATTVTVTVLDNGDTPNAVVPFTVIEFWSNLMSSNGVQRGTITIAAAANSNTATITSVNTNKAVLFPGGWSCSATARSGYVMARAVLTNSTTVTASRQTNDGATTVTYAYQIAEFL